MKRYLIWAGVGLAIIAGLIVILPFVIPVGAWRGTIERAAHDATGRTLTIAGPMRLTIFPRIGLEAEDVHFSNPAGSKEPEMARLGALHVSVAVLPLLAGKIEVSGITLEKPVIHLEVDKDGRNNWTFAKAKTDGGKTGAGTAPAGLVLSGVNIAGGAITYDNAETGRSLAVDKVYLNADVTRLDAPAAISGHFTRAGTRIDFDGHVSTPASLSAGAATKLALSLKSDLADAAFDGSIGTAHAVQGHLDADAPSAAKLGAWLGEDVPAGLGKVSLSAALSYRNRVATLDDLNVALGGMHVTGRLSVATAGARPRVSGTLNADRFDVNAFMQSGADNAAQKQSAPQGWSTKPIALDALTKIDADLVLHTGALAIRKLAMGKTALTLRISGGVLNADLDPMTLYGGSGRAAFAVDAHGPVAQFRGRIAFDHVAMSRVLGDAIGVSKIEGTGKLALDLSSQGGSADAVMHALSGKGAISVSNGQIKGVNLGLVAATVQSALSGKAIGADANTEFTQLSDSFVIAKGVATTADFKLSGPVLEATGKGRVDIGNRKIDFMIVPKANVAVAKLGIPFRISGPWEDPHYLPDIGGLATGVVQGLAGGATDAGSLIGGMLGGGKSGDKNTKKKPSNPLSGIFGGQ